MKGCARAVGRIHGDTAVTSLNASCVPHKGPVLRAGYFEGSAVHY